jgi:hypothetical protein
MGKLKYASPDFKIHYKNHYFSQILFLHFLQNYLYICNSLDLFHIIFFFYKNIFTNLLSQIYFHKFTFTNLLSQIYFHKFTFKPKRGCGEFFPHFYQQFIDKILFKTTIITIKKLTLKVKLFFQNLFLLIYFLQIYFLQIYFHFP